jgi:hypothetical protein
MVRPLFGRLWGGVAQDNAGLGHMHLAVQGDSRGRPADARDRFGLRETCMSDRRDPTHLQNRP